MSEIERHAYDCLVIGAGTLETVPFVPAT